MSELKECPFCGIKQLTDEEAEETVAYTGQTRVCDNCGATAKDWNTRPLEDALQARIAELEAEVEELKPYRDGYDGYDDHPEEGETVIARLRNWVFLAQHRGDYWYDALGYKEKIRGEVERWWKLPEVQE